MAPRLPSDALRSRSPRRVAALALAAVVVVAGISVGGVALAQSFHPALGQPATVATVAPADTVPTLSPSDAASVQQAADAQQAQVVAAAAAKAAADAAAAQAAAAAHAATQKAAAPTVTKCPAGTKANAVDAAGNQSNCQPLNGAGQSCQAYDNNNNCTAWGALSVWPLKP